MATEKLTARSLNRALLARQLLLARERRGVLETVRFLAGMQSQVPGAPYVGLWTRLLGFDPEEVSGLMTERALVRVSAMRGTVHLLDAADALAWRPLCQVINDRGPYGKNIYRKALSGIDPVRLKQTAAELLAEQPMTNAALGAALAEAFPGHDPGTLAWAIRDGLALVQVPPRGLWGKSGQTTSTTLEHWLGRPLDPDPAPDAMVLRYLAAFGPAGVLDAQAWSGLTRLVEVFERLRPRLRAFQDAATGRELFDLPDAPRPDPDTPAPARFLPEYDNVTLAHYDRSRIVTPQALDGLRQVNGYKAAFLVDGQVRGHWTLSFTKAGADLTVSAHTKLDDQEMEALDDEAEKLVRFHRPAVSESTVRFPDPG
ncbi:winged helix DNA-binding domain-containing protein [Streptacidiphilus carbonis]|uniref:winged helix DNA-binding domain-containing protein n=1 Tax=Streptacidiphilus carbonis TaxID=105422 RepID=UPI0005A98966|nr:winged helix DNA-binding domain-containing protein [Streptacidiphilus carbonis]